MENTNRHTLLWAAAGLLFSLLALLAIISGLSGKVFVTDPEGIPQAADQILTCVQSGDWESLRNRVAGTPVLKPETGEPGSAEAILWEAYQKSLQWTVKDAYSVSGHHVAQTVTVTCLDIPGVTRKMAGILEDQTLDANHREDDSLVSAARQVLKTGAPEKQCEITLTFLREKGQWLLVPDNALQALLSGFTVR